MTTRLPSLVLLTALLVVPASAKEKKTSTLPEDVLRATTALVVISPDAGEPVDRPTANATARDSVEKAFMQWGRFRLVMPGEEADLVIAVRTGSGKMMQPTIKGGPIDQRPGTVQTGDGSVRIGARQGQPPPLSDPGAGPPQNGPRMSNEVGASEDTFEVYRGHGQYPLESPAVWRYIAKDCLREPGVTAVEEFRKAIAKAQQPPPPPKP
jgi:hypothetical protein